VANETQNIKLMEEVWAIDEDIEAFGTAAGERLRGWDAIRKVFIHQFNTFTDTYISERDQIVNIDETGNVAWFSQMVNYNFLLEGTPKKYEGVRFTGVMKKKSGHWKLVQIHMSMPH
jgi:ketosteroid isomerase-like protein